MNRIENSFYTEFKLAANLELQPTVKIKFCNNWRPDFLDLNTGIYYEVVGSQSTFSIHHQKGHFDSLVKAGFKLVIAVYLKNTNSFLLFNWFGEAHLPYEQFYKLIETKEYDRKYGDINYLYPVENLYATYWEKKLDKKRGKLIKLDKHIKTNQYEKIIIPTARTTFNSYMASNEYTQIKTEAVELQITVKQHISNILSDYVQNKQVNFKINNK